KSGLNSAGLTESEFTKILDWPGYRVYRHEIDERTRRLRLWVRRKRGNRLLICSGCGGKASKIEEVREREVRDLPWRKYQTTVMVEYYRIRCPKCGLKTEEVPQLRTKAPFSKDFEDAVGLSCDSAAARQVARQFGLAASTVRAIDLRCLERWHAEARIVYDKFHIMQHANHAVDEVRRAEFFRKGGRMRGIVKGKRWLLLTRWVNLESHKRQELNGLFALNRRVMKAYLLKES